MQPRARLIAVLVALGLIIAAGICLWKMLGAPPSTVITASGPASSQPTPGGSALPAKAARPGAGKTGPKVPLASPAAQEALKSVGIDPDAQATWLKAINDPNVPAEERRNLIEDLNEAGFANPKTPTAADLPLIQARIELIDRLLPGALDAVNADAFREARKDLVEMAAKAR